MIYFRSPGNNLGLDKFGQIISAHVLVFLFKVVDFVSVQIGKPGNNHCIFP